MPMLLGYGYVGLESRTSFCCESASTPESVASFNRLGEKIDFSRCWDCILKRNDTIDGSTADSLTFPDVHC